MSTCSSLPRPSSRRGSPSQSWRLCEGGCKLAPPLATSSRPLDGGRTMRFLGTLVALLVLLAAAPVGAQSSPPVEKGSSVKMEYTLKDDKGQVLDSSEGKEPIAFVQGAHQIIPGLDKALLGMKVGDTKKVTVNPDEGYGVVDPKAETEVPKDALPKGADVVGTRLLARGQDGHPRPVTVKAVKDNTVVLDLNHPLAGKTLFFDIKVVSVEPPKAPTAAPAPK